MKNLKIFFIWKGEAKNDTSADLAWTDEHFLEVIIYLLLFMIGQQLLHSPMI